MIRIIPMLCSALLATLFAAGGLPAAAQSTVSPSSTPVFDWTSSGLITFSDKDKAIRVTVVFADHDAAVVETVVNFFDASGTILKKQRGELRDGEPVVAELTRRDVADRPDLLVRVQVIHKLPGKRERRYPILVTLQPISSEGFGRWLQGWNGGGCGGPEQGPHFPNGTHADCTSHDLPISF
jgi:hypothetical protein